MAEPEAHPLGWGARTVFHRPIEIVGVATALGSGAAAPPAAAAMRVPGVRSLLRSVERRLADTPAAFFAGFYVAVLRKSVGD